MVMVLVMVVSWCKGGLAGSDSPVWASSGRLGMLDDAGTRNMAIHHADRRRRLLRRRRWSWRCGSTLDSAPAAAPAPRLPSPLSALGSPLLAFRLPPSALRSPLFQYGCFVCLACNGSTSYGRKLPAQAPVVFASRNSEGAPTSPTHPQLLPLTSANTASDAPPLAARPTSVSSTLSGQRVIFVMSSLRLLASLGASLPPASELCAKVAAVFVAWLVGVAVFRRCFHPLAHIPGPFWASITHLYIVKYNLFSGRSLFYLQIDKLHAQFGRSSDKLRATA